MRQVNWGKVIDAIILAVFVGALILWMVGLVVQSGAQ